MVVLCANVSYLLLSNAKPYSRTSDEKVIPNADYCREPCWLTHGYGLSHPNVAGETETPLADYR